MMTDKDDLETYHAARTVIDKAKSELEQAGNLPPLILGYSRLDECALLSDGAAVQWANDQVQRLENTPEIRKIDLSESGFYRQNDCGTAAIPKANVDEKITFDKPAGMKAVIQLFPEDSPLGNLIDGNIRNQQAIAPSLVTPGDCQRQLDLPIDERRQKIDGACIRWAAREKDFPKPQMSEFLQELYESTGIYLTQKDFKLALQDAGKRELICKVKGRWRPR
jgi:hypothetical protein